ncbi:MAG: DUF4136 domain-containing protein [Pseudomonadota bacterium]|nr:DUF4136 domain-containing protein [Pseudomonadota bacterium]
MKSNLRRWILLFVSLQLVACGTTVNVDYDQATDFAALRSYELQTRPVKISDDPRIDSSLMQQRVVTALRETLSQKGLRASPKADVRVSYRIDVKQEIETDASGVSVGVGTFSRNVGIGFGYGFPAADVESYDRIILTIDFHNPADKLLWRGSDSRRLTSGSTPETLTRLVNELVTAILERYPPN